MKKQSAVYALAMCLLLAGLAQGNSFTVATFSDPSNNSSNPLFAVDFGGSAITGGWADSQTGLTLNIPYAGTTFTNAWFNMDTLSIVDTQSIWGVLYGKTGAGQIRFYADGSSTSPLVVVAFGEAFVSQQSLGGDDFIGQNVIITGSQIAGTLSLEKFSFSFANIVQSQVGSGFTATAAFTSSAVPEPMTIGLLSLGGITLFRKKNFF